MRSDRELAAALGMLFDAFGQRLSRGRKAIVDCLRSFSIDIKIQSDDARERAMLVEEATSAWRPRTPDGRTRERPAWAALDARGRREALRKRW